MSQKRGNKRRGGTEPVDSHDQPLLLHDNVSKRAKLHNKDFANPSVSGSDKECTEKNVVRRSGRTPKAKVRDYDDITNALSSPDLSVPKDTSFLSNSVAVSEVRSSLNVTSEKRKLDFLSSIDDAKAAPEISKEKSYVNFEVGHKRETRKSYQKYLEESLNTGIDPSTDVVKIVHGVDSPKTGLKSLGKKTHPRSNVTSGPDIKTIGKSSRKIVPEQEPVSKYVTITNTTPEDQTEGEWESTPPKVRISKRTPIPKRKFSLLEDSGYDSKKTKTKESPLSETEKSYTKEHQTFELKLQAKNQDARPISESKTKDPPFENSTTPSGSVLAPKEISRGRRLTSASQRKPSISKVKYAKSSDSQFLLANVSPGISGEILAIVPKSQDDFPVTEQITHQKKTENKRKKKAPTPTGVESVGSDLSNASFESNIPEVKANLVPKSIISQNNLKSKEKTKKSAAKKDLKETSNQGVNADFSSCSGDNSLEISLPPSVKSPKSALGSKLERSSSGLAVHSSSDFNKKKKKKKQSKEVTARVISESEPSQEHHHHHHHHHKHHKHSKTKKTTEAASAEVREEAGEHIILKLHLYKDERSKKLEAKKQKSKTPSSESSAESQTQSHSKSKKSKRSDTPQKGLSSWDSDKIENKMKLSIKFKGLSKSQGKVELPCGDNVLSSDQESQESVSEKGKQNKDGNKTKCVDSIEKQQKTNKKDQEKQPVKLVIKKDKTFSNVSEIRDETNQSPVQKTKKNFSTEQKKKGKEESFCKSASPTKPLSAYLLFCKKQRPKVKEENRGLEFSQISKKVGEAWNSLPEEEKQNWKDKAAEMKQQLEASGTLSSGKKTESKADARPDKPLKQTKISSPSKAESVTSNSTAQPIDMAAHLKLLGESLMTVGILLKQQNQLEVHGSLSVLLDSALCAISPVLFLTSQIPEAAGVSMETQVQILDNIAYIMPGL